MKGVEWMELESLIEKKCMQLLNQALELEASDLHMLPTREHYQLFFRKYNRLMAAGEIPLTLGEKMISHFKYQSVLDISEKRRPQSGSFEYITEQKQIACRVSTLPSSTMKESMVVRLMIQNVAKPLQDIVLQIEAAKHLEQIVQAKQGIVLFCGPTGCGKSTTMYALLQYCSKQLSKHVISLEDPVESQQQNMLQIQVNERSGVTYSAGLKAILRHSPDVIMIGEIRDQETAKIAIEAALTGHLVISTIHAKNSFGCLHRLLDLGISKDELEQTILSITTQQLVVENTEQQPLKALYEFLDAAHLQDAFDALKQQQNYQLPLQETIRYKMMCGIEDGGILPNVLTT